MDVIGVVGVSHKYSHSSYCHTIFFSGVSIVTFTPAAVISVGWLVANKNHMNEPQSCGNVNTGPKTSKWVGVSQSGPYTVRTLCVRGP
jgi:hypothetical protein